MEIKIRETTAKKILVGGKKRLINKTPIFSQFRFILSSDKPSPSSFELWMGYFKHMHWF